MHHAIISSPSILLIAATAATLLSGCDAMPENARDALRRFRELPETRYPCKPPASVKGGLGVSPVDNCDKE